MTLAEFPHPSWQEIAISLQLFIILYPVRWLLRKAELKAVRAERNLIIRTHVKSGHKSRLKQCVEGKCTLLSRTDLSPQGLQAAVVGTESVDYPHMADHL